MPSRKDYNQPGSTCLVSIIEQKSSRMIIEIVPDRKIKTMTNLIRKRVLVETTIINDGYPYYHQVLRNSICMYMLLIIIEVLKTMKDITQTILKICGLCLNNMFKGTGRTDILY
ncbi:hypothetical protein DMUE_5333 [Dictyocoela muelleri]|nr:hypothetical protein DMUE_5333 [Dictyocoela muelleri]